MKKTVYILAAALAFVAASCAKDDSTSFQIELPEVSIAEDNGIKFKAGVESVYEPSITWAGTSPEDYNYAWVLSTKNGRDTISTDRILNYTFGEISGTSADAILLSFLMEKKDNGLRFGQDFQVTITTAFFLGWTVLSEGTDGSAHLSFIEMTSFESMPDVFAKNNPGISLGSKPRGLVFHGASKKDEILVLKDDAEGPVELDGVSFAKVSAIKDEFVGGELPSEPNFEVNTVAYSHKGSEILLSKSGKIYERTTLAVTGSTYYFQDALFSPAPFIHASGEDYRATYYTFPGSASNHTLLWDDLNKRWMSYYNTNTTVYTVPVFLPGTSKFEAGYDYCNGMASDVEMVYAQTYNEASHKPNLAAIYKKGSDYSLITCLGTYATASKKMTVSNHKQVSLNACGFDASTKFMMPRGASTSYANNVHIFFNVGKKLYFYRASDAKAYLYRDFTVGNNLPKGDIVSIEQNGNATQMAVSFSDGHVYIMDLTLTKVTGLTNGNVDPANVEKNGLEKAHISDIPGTIVSTIFKYGKAANYTGAKIAY